MVEVELSSAAVGSKITAVSLLGALHLFVVVLHLFQLHPAGEPRFSGSEIAPEL